MDLFPYQTKAIDSLLSIPRGVLLAPCGSGKTIMIITIINRLYEPGKNILVISPKNVISTAFAEHSQFINPSIPYGFFTEVNGVTFINRERISTLKRRMFDVVLVDESSLFKSSQSMSYKRLLKITSVSERVYLFTGSMYCNNLRSVFPQLMLINPKMYRSELEFLGLYFKQVGALPTGTRLYEENKSAVSEIFSRIKEYIVKVEKSAVFMPTYKINICKYNGSADFYKVYNSFNKIQFMRTHNLLTTLDACHLNWKRHQLISGGFYNDSDEYIPIHRERADLIHQLLEKIFTESPSDNCIIFYNYRFELENLRKDLQGYDVEEYIPGDKAMGQILLLSQKSGSHGLNLQQYNNIIYYSLTHSTELFVQSISRVVRTHQKRVVNIYLMQCAKTIEVRILAKLKAAGAINVENFNGIIEL
ncbi:MAG: DEAD/DEAH box helicase family protein [Paraclostridium sp.]